ncbi:PREDICTED: cytidine deaminase 1 [Ipomoea nil]|uniref:cytidine deaminase 1 n=1 Tax=Ipomoea nil TaxID=35883 RepID=UPI000900A8F3|nr:PREDICTED: cytidine deaminase 1 [Ipomoea nil]
MPIDVMGQPKFVIEASEAESMAQSVGLPGVSHLLPALVKPAQALARPPISNFPVAAVGLASDGRVFIGVNVEFPGLPLSHSVHAEQFLVTNLLANGGPRLVSLAVSAAPCGHCRQFLQELRYSSSLQILVISQTKDDDSDVTFKPLSQFLPSHFGPFDLLDHESPLLLEPHNNGLSLSDIVAADNSILLKISALEAANESHAPYSHCPSGVALMDCEGKVYKGSYTESAAYNPSLGPVQAALIAFIAGGGGGYERIVAAALVEKEDPKVRQEDTASLLLKVISPKCEFKVYHCPSDANLCKKASP